MTERPQSLGEEIANSVSHGAALLAAILAVPMLFDATRHLGAANVVGAAVFAATMVLLYLTSTLYHALPPGRAKRVFMKLDHGAIYLFIAGSYTPFALGVLGGPWGWTLFGLVWSIAAVGVTLEGLRPAVASLAFDGPLSGHGLAGARLPPRRCSNVCRRPASRCSWPADSRTRWVSRSSCWIRGCGTRTRSGTASSRPAPVSTSSRY